MHFRHILLSLFVVTTLGSATTAQTVPEAFYWYDGKKVILKKSATTVAAKALESVDYERKFPRISKYFREVGSSALRNEPVLLQAAESHKSSSEEAIRSGIKTKEIYKLSVFEVGNTKLILQNELIVGFKEDKTDSTGAEALITRFSKTFSRQPGRGLRYLVRVPDPTRTLAWADILYRNKTVAYAEPNFVILQPSRPSAPADVSSTIVTPSAPAATGANASANATVTFPSDTLFPQQWALAKIGAQKAWLSSHGSNLIRIAVLDDGVDVNHPDLKDKIEKSYDMLFDSEIVDPPATDAHGTAVAGIAGAATNNSLGIAGLAADVRLLPIRMMSSVDQSTESNTLLIVSNAFDKAVELGADVINCSWTMSVPSKDVEGAIQAAATRGRHGLGSVVIFAAGNEGGEVSFPANLSRPLPIIAVGASNEQDEFKTAGSSDGETFWASNFGAELTVVAPGVHIATTTHRGRIQPGAEPYISGFNGTSSAAPLVAGLAALILSVEPALTPDQVRQRIISTADLVVKLPDSASAFIGRINACRALGRTDCAQ